MIFIRYFYKAFLFVKTLVMEKYYTGIFKLKLFLNEIKYGKRLKCYNSIPLLQINCHSGVVSFGDNVIFNSYTDHSWYSKCKLIVLANASLLIGHNSGMNGVMIYCSKYIKIGNNVKIGGSTRVSDSNHHSLDYQIRRSTKDSEDVKSAPIIIGDDVFIGANCYIGKGISIGNKSIIAAGSVVVKTIPSGEIWGGNPAKFIKRI